MDFSFQNIILIVASLLCFFGSYHNYKNQKHNIALGLLFLGGFLLRVYTSFDPYLHEWDERYHALVAKNLMNNMLVPTLYQNPVLQIDFKDWTANHIWVHKQPLPLWLMAISFKLFGINTFAGRIPSVILSSLAILLVYRIALWLYNHRVAYLSALFMAINGLIIEITAGRVATDHVDVAFFFFILLGMYFTIKNLNNDSLFNVIMIGVSIGLAILCKWLPALIVLLFYLILHYNRKSNKQLIYDTTIIVLTTFIISFPWQYYIITSFPKEAWYEYQYNARHLTESLGHEQRAWWYFIDQIRINYHDLIYLPLIWFGYKTVKRKDRQKSIALMVFLFLPIVFFSFAATKMKGYILFTSPILFVVTAMFIHYLITFKQKLKVNNGVINLLLVLLMLVPVRYSIERVKPFQKRENSDWVVLMKQIKQMKLPKNTVLFNVSNPVEIMFYTGIESYVQKPEMEQIKNLKSKGLNCYMVIENIDIKEI